MFHYDAEEFYITRKEAMEQVIANPKETLNQIFFQQDEVILELKRIIERQRADVAYECDAMLDELVPLEAEND